MRTIIGALVILAFAGFTVASGQDKEKDKIDVKKLMGKWEPKEGKVVIEFADKGKLTLSVDADGKSSEVRRYLQARWEPPRDCHHDSRQGAKGNAHCQEADG